MQDFIEVAQNSEASKAYGDRLVTALKKLLKDIDELKVFAATFSPDTLGILEKLDADEVLVLLESTDDALEYFRKVIEESGINQVSARMTFLTLKGMCIHDVDEVPRPELGPLDIDLRKLG